MRFPVHCLVILTVCGQCVAGLPVNHAPRASRTVREEKRLERPLKPLQATGALRIRERNPVVNERNTLALTPVDADGAPVTGVTWESGSPDIARIDPETGRVTGVERGFATVTARRGNDSASVFLTVARLENGAADRVPGQQSADAESRLYISNPRDGVILRKDGLTEPATVYAGRRGENGMTDGQRTAALFNTPTGVDVDNSRLGGVYVADTANHGIRKIDFSDRVTTVLGKGMPGTMTLDVTPFADAVFRGVRGVAVDNGGNLFIADTENHAIFYADFERREVRLLAGTPGTRGRQDGRGRNATFNFPSSITLSSDGRLAVITDRGSQPNEGRIRIIDRAGEVTSLGKASSAQVAAKIGEMRVFDQEADALIFNQPESADIDGAGNIYVVDRDGVKVVTRPFGREPDIVSLAQEQVSFQRAAGVTISRAASFVIDAEAETADQALKVVTVGAPQIDTLNISTARMEGGEEVIVTGRNFAPESLVVLGDGPVEATNLRVVSATEIRFRVPPQTIGGTRTLTVQTRGGTAQRPFSILPKRVGELGRGEISTVAGGISYVGDGGSALSERVALAPADVAVDTAGNLLIPDVTNHRVRRIDAQTGIITTLAGNGGPSFSGDGGPATAAGLNFPAGLAVAPDGDIFIADSLNHRVRRIDAATGTISTVAGNGRKSTFDLGTFSGDGGPATRAGLSLPSSLAIDSRGVLYIADTGNNRIRRVDLRSGVITTVAGTGDDDFRGDGGPATAAALSQPYGVGVDGNDNLLIGDTGNNRVRRVDAQSGVIVTVAGSGEDDFNGDGGAATNAALSAPVGVAVDAGNNIFFTDYNNERVRRVDAATGIVTTVAGNGETEFTGDGQQATTAALNGPIEIAFDLQGNLFIADFGNSRLRRVSGRTGTISTVAGSGNASLVFDGASPLGSGLRAPRQAVVDARGNTFIADTFNHRIRRIDAATGTISTYAGTGEFSRVDYGGTFSGDGGPATEAGLNLPMGIALDAQGNLFIADAANHRVRRVDARTGIISTVAGNGRQDELGEGTFGGDGGPAIQAGLNVPFSVALDALGNLLIADSGNHRVRQVDARTGTIMTVAGNGDTEAETDEGRATELGLNFPTSVVFDPTGNFYIADSDNHLIWYVETGSGMMRLVAGTGDVNEFDGGTFSGDGGEATSAGLNYPTGLSVDSQGNLFFADEDNLRVRRIDARTNVITTVAGNGTEDPGGDGGAASRAGLLFPTGTFVDAQGDLYVVDSGSNRVRVVKGVVGR